MTEQLKQSLSAVVDGEADAFELRRVLDELERDAELRATWSRYHLIGSVIRGERTAATPVPEFGSGRTLADTGNATSAAAAHQPGKRRAGMGFGAAMVLAAMTGLAVGVAVDLMDVDRLPRVAEIGADPLGRIDPSNTDFARSDLRDNLRLQGDPGDLPTSEVVGAAPEALSLAQQQRVRAYMLQHAQQQALDQRGVISLVKMATYQAP